MSVHFYSIMVVTVDKGSEDLSPRWISVLLFVWLKVLVVYFTVHYF